MCLMQIINLASAKQLETELTRCIVLCCSLSALIDNRIFCVHGGLSPTISSLDQARPVCVPRVLCLQVQV